VGDEMKIGRRIGLILVCPGTGSHFSTTITSEMCRSFRVNEQLRCRPSVRRLPNAPETLFLRKLGGFGTRGSSKAQLYGTASAPLPGTDAPFRYIGGTPLCSGFPQGL
jgi:hypothetical protein